MRKDNDANKQGLQQTVNPSTHLQTIRDNAANIVSQLDAAIKEIDELAKLNHALTVRNKELFKSHQAICSAVQKYDYEPVYHYSENAKRLRLNMVELATGVKSPSDKR